jgi:hypothetical protein
MKQTSITNLLSTYQRILVLALFLMALILQVLVVLPAQAVVSATMSASPASGSYTTGQTITVSVVINTNGNNVNATQANFSFNSALMQYQSFDFGSSAFGIPAEASVSGSTVRIARGTSTPVNGSSVLVGKVVFKALAAGNATVSFLGDCTVVSSDSNSDILGTKNGATYTISQPAPPPSTGTTTTTTPTTTSTPTTTKTTSTTPKTTTSAPTAASPTETTAAPDTEPTVEQTANNTPITTDTGGTTSDTESTPFNWQVVSYVGAALISLVMLSVAAWWLLGKRTRPHHASLATAHITASPPTAPDNHLDAGERLVMPGQAASQSAPSTPSATPTTPTPPNASEVVEPQVIAPTGNSDKKQ